MSKRYNIAVVGATGCVGKQVLDSLVERKFPVSNIKAIASQSSIGKEISFDNRKLSILSLDCKEAGENNDIVFFCTSNDISAKYIPLYAKKGAVCIDKSSYYRLDQQVPLIIPEINKKLLSNYKNKNIIASPNCCVIPLAIALAYLHEKFKIKRIVVSTYQSVSGAGKEAMEELEQQTKDIVNSYRTLIKKTFPKQIAFNIIPQIGPYLDDGDTDEESKIKSEINKIFNDEIKVAVTSVRVPVFIGHSMSVNIEFSHEITVNSVINALKNQESVMLCEENNYLTPIEVAGKDFVNISRVRLDYSSPNTINLWVSADNLRKGAGLNAVHIAEELIKLF